MECSPPDPSDERMLGSKDLLPIHNVLLGRGADAAVSRHDDMAAIILLPQRRVPQHLVRSAELLSVGEWHKHLISLCHHQLTPSTILQTGIFASLLPLPGSMCSIGGCCNPMHQPSHIVNLTWP